AIGFEASATAGSNERHRELRQLAGNLLREKVSDQRCPADARIERFLNAHFADVLGESRLRLPSALVLPCHGVARELSLPSNSDCFRNEILTSYRVRNGVLHNPRSDRRTTKGTFHVCEGGLPIPGDKQAVPRATYVRLLQHAVNPPDDVLVVPLTSDDTPVRAFCSLLLRPVVCPAVPGVNFERSLEVRFFAPAGLVSNLDFVESIFGNAGDPYVPENDAGLDVEHWTGHTGCVILAPHLTRLTKQELGLPEWAQATERQRRDGMCWRDPEERYNDGQAFKVTCRDASGVIVTLIADNYYGYCKKEVKTQISYSANLLGSAEEEHSGGTIAFASYNLGLEFQARDYRTHERTLEQVAHHDPSTIVMQHDGYAIDPAHDDLIFIPHDARASVSRLEVWWQKDGVEKSLMLRPGKTYMTPSGYKLQLQKHPTTGSWRLIGTVAEGRFCHKPCTVSGGGKSEISKNLHDYIIYGPIFVADLDKDFELVQKLLDHDFGNRWKPGRRPANSVLPSRPLLSPDRSLGSVIKLLTPSDDYTPEYNSWLASFPDHIYPLVFIIKRFIPAESIDHWRDFLNVDSINGRPGHELKAQGRRLAGGYLRVGLLASQQWRTFKVRQDFAPSVKIQTEDDITASTVVPASQISHLGLVSSEVSYKFATNCEYRLFQRPDDAIHRGLDKQTEADLARSDNFISNFEPLSSEQCQRLADRVTEFDLFTKPMRRLLKSTAAARVGTVVSSAHARLVDGKPSKNPRYLQIRPDLTTPDVRYIAERGMRLARGLSSHDPVSIPVHAVLIGRRNNPPDREAGIRPLSVYGPIHYQELPELFMDVICSLTGKSPSTTGAGSEGALTKGPFNALRTIVDVNAALVSAILTGLGGFSSAAGHIGPQHRVDHDVSLLIPEIWCRLSVKERDPAFLIAEGHLERVQDFQFAGRVIPGSRLGYRITARFVRTFLGRIFDHPDRVFEASFLRPETQDLEAFVDGIENITEAQQRVALQTFEDGSIDDACPPLKALLSIMAYGSFEDMDAQHPKVRGMFTREALLASNWYRDRLQAKQECDGQLWQRHVATLDDWLKSHVGDNDDLVTEMQRRRAYAAQQLEQSRSPGYLDNLRGTLGVDPSLYRSTVGN
ncbi:MAG TPA: hypothetical protein VFG20_22275, partial [Planctomycetaceae bacterium]|nr:hypothetical protein [Planctomycetaceae bacterium]